MSADLSMLSVRFSHSQLFQRAMFWFWSANEFTERNKDQRWVTDSREWISCHASLALRWRSETEAHDQVPGVFGELKCSQYGGNYSTTVPCDSTCGTMWSYHAKADRNPDQDQFWNKFLLMLIKSCALVPFEFSASHGQSILVKFTSVAGGLT